MALPVDYHCLGRLAAPQPAAACETLDSKRMSENRGTQEANKLRRYQRWLLAACLWLPAGIVAAQEGPPAEVTSRDWSYQALQDMASRGLVHGYKDAKFLEGRKLTRFEMASLVKRVMDSLLQLPVPEDGKPIVPEQPGPAAARGQGYEPPPLPRSLSSGSSTRTASFTESDLGVVQRLADEYSVELAVIGVNLGETTQRLSELSGRVEAIEKGMQDPKGPLQTAISDIARINRIRFSGYVQARYQSYEHTNEAVSDSRSDSVVDTFTLRRVRLSVAARPTQKIAVRWQIDGAGDAVETRDAWIDYFFTGNPATGHTATIGQFKTPFGFQLVQSSSVREAPERGRVIRYFFPDERDRGVKIAGPTGKKLFYELAVLNGIIRGSRGGTNEDDNNNNKNVAGRIRYSPSRRVDLGVSFDMGTTLRTNEFPDDPFNVDDENPRENNKLVFGADAQFQAGQNTILRAEWMGGKGNGTYASGYILNFIQNIGRRNQVVFQYDWFGIDDFAIVQRAPVATPLGSNGLYSGTLSTLAVGLVHELRPNTRLKLFYEIHKRGRETVAGDPFQWLGNVLRFEVISVF